MQCLVLVKTLHFLKIKSFATKFRAQDFKKRKQKCSFPYCHVNKKQQHHFIFVSASDAQHIFVQLYPIWHYGNTHNATWVVYCTSEVCTLGMDNID